MSDGVNSIEKMIASGDLDNYDHSIPHVMYVTTNIPGIGIDFDEFESVFTVGCSCSDNCRIQTCSCIRETVNYINDRINPHKTSGLILECSSACSCSINCSNRLVQRGPLSCLQTFETPAKGLGLKTTKLIQANQFICEYAGEIIGINEAKRRIEDNRVNEKMNYILVVIEHIGDNKLTTCIDPSYFGNIGRYCNHSCQPSAKLLPIRVEGLSPRLCLFAIRDIGVGEEITFDYGNGLEVGEGNFSRTKCLCGADCCTGFLPHHPI